MPERSGPILVVDDEDDIRNLVAHHLQRDGLTVLGAANGADALDLARAHAPALIILDLMLPGMNGTEVCRRLRADAATKDIPIIMLSARSEEIDRVVGFEVGADDYVTKPFRLRELVARVRAAMRRVPRTVDAPELSEETIEVGDIVIDVARHEVAVRGDLVPLPLKEFELLEILMLNAGRVLTRDVLIDRVWGPNYFGDTKTLDVHVKRLRSKIEDDPAAPTRIVTVRGVGYRFEGP